MVDIKKRNAMKILGGTAVIASVPSFAVANATFGDKAFEVASKPDVVVPLNTGTELSIAMSLESEPTVTLTNHSAQLIIVRHVHPGIVHAGARTFDINSIFSDGAHAVEAGRSRTFKIGTTVSTQSETTFPRHLYRKQPQRVAALKGTDNFGEVVNSSRSFYS